MDWYLEPWRRFADFSERSRRKEYRIFCLINCLISIVFYIFKIMAAVEKMNSLVTVLSSLMLIYFLAALIPGLAVTVRRLHDTGKSGWFILVSLMPMVGGIILIVLLALDGEWRPNQYGPSPKYVG